MSCFLLSDKLDEKEGGNAYTHRYLYSLYKFFIEKLNCKIFDVVILAIASNEGDFIKTGEGRRTNLLLTTYHY